MPIYEYRCRQCRRRFTKFFRSFTAVAELVDCPHCGATAVDRLLSRVVVRRSAGREEPASEWIEAERDTSDETTDVYDEEPDLPDLPDTEDPREFARWMRGMAAAAGEPLEPAFERALQDLERGEDPDRVMERLEEETSGTVPESAGDGDTEEMV